MSDPRNAAHDKKVKQEKAHHASASDEPKPNNGDAASSTSDENGTTPPPIAVEQGPGELEKSLAVLSKLKEMEHYSRANIETLAGMMLTIDDELKQKEFSDSVGALYSAQDGFQTQITVLVESYGAKCESLKPAV